MSIDELNRLLTASKWTLGVLAVLTALAGIFNQWVSDRIGVLQTEQKVESQRKLEASESELRQTKARTEQLEARLAPRSLSPAQIQSIRDHLTPYAGTKFQFVSYQDDAEVHGLVLQLIPMLQQAGWKGLPAQEFLMASLVVGVTIEYAPASKRALERPAIAFADALTKNGIVATTVANPELAERADRIRVKVGKKPE
ncbi:MAG: hypothetical protein OJK14_08365 [Achromobacter sp.]|uniref:hypothetical protein n=1 Tax=Achromobacter sp. TaxID=134375 RepID=UPI002583DC44|nr:hypothetical protein [Achromobacter sp.]MCW0207100.1 hypothetical protein [Achromobacter sp.]